MDDKRFKRKRKKKKSSVIEYATKACLALFFKRAVMVMGDK